jgi:hypothetical protein
VLERWDLPATTILKTAGISRQIVVKNRRNEWAWESCKPESVEGVQVTKHERMCQKRTRWRRSDGGEAMEEGRGRFICPIYSTRSVNQSAKRSRMGGAVELAMVFLVNVDLGRHDTAADPNKSCHACLPRNMQIPSSRCRRGPEVQLKAQKHCHIRSTYRFLGLLPDGRSNSAKACQG